MRQTGNLTTDSVRALKLWRVWTTLARNDLRARFTRSLLGRLWLVLGFAIWSIGVGYVYAQIFHLEVKEFLPFLTLGFALWGFITATFTETSVALISSAGYVKQFNLPKQVYIYRSVMVQALTFMSSLLVCLVILAIVGKFSIASIAMSIPGLAVLLLAGLLQGFLSAYIAPYLRDYPHAVGSLLSVIFFLTPIIFPPNILHERGLDFLLTFNPFYYLLELVREPLTTGVFPAAKLWMGAGVYLAILAVVTFVVTRYLDKRVVYAL